MEGRLDDKGCSIHTQQETKTVYIINGKFCFQGIKDNGLYVWEPNNFAQSFLASMKPQIKMELWHLRMGHLNITDLKRLKNLSTGMDFTGKEQVEFCEYCCQAKMILSPFKNEGHKAEHMYQ